MRSASGWKHSGRRGRDLPCQEKLLDISWAHTFSTPLKIPFCVPPLELRCRATMMATGKARVPSRGPAEPGTVRGHPLYPDRTCSSQQRNELAQGSHSVGKVQQKVSVWGFR